MGKLPQRAHVGQGGARHQHLTRVTHTSHVSEPTTQGLDPYGRVQHRWGTPRGRDPPG